MLSFLQLRYMDTVPCDMSELTFGIFYSSGSQPFVLCIHTNQHQNFTAGCLAVSCSVVCRQLPQSDPVFTWDECCVLLLKKRRALLNSANLQALFFFFFKWCGHFTGIGLQILTHLDAPTPGFWPSVLRVTALLTCNGKCYLEVQTLAVC